MYNQKKIKEVIILYDDDFKPQEVYETSAASLNAFMVKVFGWLFAGLLLTAAASFLFIAALTDENGLARGLFANPVFFFLMVILEFVLVISLSRTLQKIKSSTAKLMYAAYAVVNGITLSYILLMYAGTAVTQAFLMAALFFGVMCLYGYLTKSDMTSLGKVLTAGLIVLVVAMMINMFIGSGALDYVVCLAGVALFVGLTAYDVQKIKNHYYHYAASSGEEVASKTAIVGALTLYLDFINMFIFILRILGRRD